MFIELTDHLRCTEPHPEAFLVLLPDALEGRRVVSGVLGCPICNREVRIEGGVAAFGAAPPVRSTSLTAEAVAALLGLDGPGGYVALLGAAGGLADALTALMPGIRWVLVNPPAGGGESPWTSVLHADRLPIKERSMRGVVVSADHGDPAWVDAALGAVLPGNRAVVEAPVPVRAGAQVLAEAGGVSVVRV
ncbi:MAG: hypothetical protein KF785_11715 [Gemmatimonadales bacterium]|nr:hypothetical protein [Gemmatimonadales bacterium]